MQVRGVNGYEGEGCEWYEGEGVSSCEGEGCEWL